jgi:transcriptional regulator with XRE-family HTH domain
MVNLEQKTSVTIATDVAKRVRTRRKEKKLTQDEMSKRAGMSLASYKRFEQKGEIAFSSIIKVAIALDCENDFDSLFSKKQFSSLQELIDEQN